MASEEYKGFHIFGMGKAGIREGQRIRGHCLQADPNWVNHRG